MILTLLKPVFIILGVIVIFNLMIIVHELGHFLAARWRGLVVEKFGIWFGKPLWKKKINGVEYSLGCIPAGGFVALPQLAPMEVMEGKVETPRDQLPPISALDKIIVAFAGPLFSFLLAFVFAVIVWQVGRPMSDAERNVVIGEVAPNSPAAEAGLQPGDKIVKVDGRPVTRFSGLGADSITWRVVRSEGETVPIEIERDGQVLTKYPKPVVAKKASWYNRAGFRGIGVGPKVSALIGKVTPGSNADKMGLQKDDVVTHVDGKEIFDSGDIYTAASAAPDHRVTLTVERLISKDAKGNEVTKTLPPIPFQPSTVRVVGLRRTGWTARLFGDKAAEPAVKAGIKEGDVIVSMDDIPATTVGELIEYVNGKAHTPIKFHIRRGTAEMDIMVTPELNVNEQTGEQRALIGLLQPSQNDGMEFMPMGKYKPVWPNPVEQIGMGIMSIVNTLDAVISRKSHVSVQHMGGPVMMMNAYYTILSGPEGWRMALWFSVVLNVNLALLNLLPIPVLDGGHITLALIEAVRRKPVNVRILEFVQTACALTIIGFMVFIAFFDVQDLPFVNSKSSGFKRVPAAEAPK